MIDRRSFVTRLIQGAAAVATLAPLPARARQRFEVDRPFRTGAELVPTAVTVRDRDGRLVTDLGREDFEIQEAGIAQPITQFTRDRVPVSLALVLDVSDSMRGPRMEDARAALVHFADELLSPEDDVALVLFNHGVRIVTPWTAERLRVREALDAARPTGGTAIYDAIGATLPLFRDRTHPRAAMIVVSDGADTASDTSVTDLKQSLARNDVFLYGIAVDTPNARSATRINPQVFIELSAQSGGYAEVITSTGEIASATERIAEELNNQYMLGYSPIIKGSPSGGRFRSIRVTARGSGYRIRARRGVVR